MKRTALAILGILAALGVFAESDVPAQEKPPPRAPSEVRKDFSFGYYANGWRKTEADTSPDVLAFETGYYGFELDMDDLTHPRFALYNDDVDYLDALKSGVKRLDALQPAELNIELEVDGTVYRAASCKSGRNQGIQRLKNTRLWESGRYVQHFDVQDVQFADAEGNSLGCLANVGLVGWPGSLALTMELAPDLDYLDGPSEGVVGTGFCVIDKPYDIPHRPELEPTNLTVEVWFKSPEKQEASDGWVLCKDENEWEEGHYGFSIGHGGKQAAALMNIGGGRENVYRITMRGFLNKGKWNHLALTYDGEMMTLYANGHRQGTNTIGKVRTPGTGTLRLGQRGDGLFGIANGLYDQVRVWNRALSEEEVKAHADNPSVLPSKDGLAYEHTFDELPGPAQKTTWSNANVRVSLKAGALQWKNEKTVPGEWKKGTRHKITLACNMPGVASASDAVALRVRTPGGQNFPVTFVDKINCRQALVEDLQRSWEPLPGPRADGGAGNNYDEFIIEVENSGTAAQRVPFQFRMPQVPGITGLVPLLCAADGTPTGLPVQLSKNWHNPDENGLFGYMLLPAQPGLSTYLLRIVYGFYGTLPSASHSQLSLIGWGGNGRWDQLAIGSWGEVICFDMDMSPTEFAITDVRGLYLRNGKEGDKWGWSDGGWGGDWLGISNTEGERFAFSEMKTAYLSQGPCLTDVRYDGGYGPGPKADLEATVRLPRVDDHARTFNTLRYTFNEEVSAEGAWLYKMGGGAFVSPKIAYGNRDGLLAEHDVPQGTMKPGEVLREPVTLEGEGPWWVAYPGGHIGDGRTWGTGSRSLVIRNYRASFDGQLVEHPTIAFPVNSRRVTEGQTDINLHLIPPTNVTAFLPGDFVELDTEWIVVPRVADDYYGPNEAFRKHLEENPRSWKTIHRAAVGNDMEVSVEGGTVVHKYPIIIQVDWRRGPAALQKTVEEKPTLEPGGPPPGNSGHSVVSVDIKGGLGMVPLRFDGLATTDGYGLYEVIDGKEVKLDQSVHGNDFWQTGLDTGSGTYRMSFNIPLDGKETSRWVLKKEPTSVAAAL